MSNTTVSFGTYGERPTRVCLCGSTRFKRAYQEWNARLTLAGAVVLSVAMHGHQMRTYPSPEQKELLDRIHLAKIDICDEIFVLDVKLHLCAKCGDVCKYLKAGRSPCCAAALDLRPYVGDSTRNEIAYARGTRKTVRFLSAEYPEWTEASCLYTEDRP